MRTSLGDFIFSLTQGVRGVRGSGVPNPPPVSRVVQVHTQHEEADNLRTAETRASSNPVNGPPRRVWTGPVSPLPTFPTSPLFRP